MAKIEQRVQDERLRSISSAMGGIAALMQSENEKLFKIGQAAAVAEAVVNAYRAYNQVLADPTLPFYAKAIAAASTLAQGLATVSSIKSTTANGTGGGGFSGGAAGSAASIPAPRRIAEFQITGTNVQGGRELVDALNEALDQGYRINLSYAG